MSVEKEINKIRARRFDVLSRVECLLSEHDFSVQVVDSDDKITRMLYPQLDVFDEDYLKCVAVKMYSDTKWSCIRLEFLRLIDREDNKWKCITEIQLNTREKLFLVKVVNFIVGYLR
jgi:hypothetical protein